MVVGTSNVARVLEWSPFRFDTVTAFACFSSLAGNSVTLQLHASKFMNSYVEARQLCDGRHSNANQPLIASNPSRAICPGGGITMSEINYKAVMITDTAIATTSVIYRTWPEAVVALGLWLTFAWVCVLGYGLFRLIALTL
jgi:hypothetical protein